MENTKLDMDEGNGWGDQSAFCRSLRWGELLDGKVVEIGKEGVLVDVGTKSEGLVPSHDLHGVDPEFVGHLKVGDDVSVVVVRPESQDGPILLSLKRAWMERGWRELLQHLEQGDIFEGKVVGSNKGGLLIDICGLRGFVPNSQVVSLLYKSRDSDSPDEAAPIVDTKLSLKAMEVDRDLKRIILSERLAVQEQRTRHRERLLGELKEGQLCKGTVRSLCEFGAFVDLGGSDGLIPLSELSWEPVKHPKDLLKVGDEVEASVVTVNQETKRIVLSLKRTQQNPWETAADKYQVGQVVRGVITNLTNFGAFARLEGGIEGLIHLSELDDRRISHPREVVKVGGEVFVKILSLDTERRRIGLSLKQSAREALSFSGKDLF
ncbi:MAG: S1 RNA-binding domain-containing protein [Chloroflexi bacterium]|nr:S1 RNA-binding domain-containing protein [Chloroflexota bacterium]